MMLSIGPLKCQYWLLTFSCGSREVRPSQKMSDFERVPSLQATYQDGMVEAVYLAVGIGHVHHMVALK